MHLHADGLEHNERGTPSSQAGDHLAQMDKRARKSRSSTRGCLGEHRGRGRDGGSDIRLLHRPGPRSLAGESEDSVAAPALARAARKLKKALEGVKRVLVVEQNHSGQFLRYLRSEYELPGEVKSLRRPGPLPFRPEEIRAAL